MRNRILFAVLGVAVTVLALSGLLGVLELVSYARPSIAENIPSDQSGKPGETSRNPTETQAGNLSPRTTEANKSLSSGLTAPSGPNIPLPGEVGSVAGGVCPVCQGEISLGKGFCPICGGTGKLGSGKQIIPSISPQGGLGPHIPLFKVSGAANTALLRSIVTAGYDGEAWNLDPEAKSATYKGEKITPPVSGYNRQTIDDIEVSTFKKFAPGEMTLPTSLYPVSLNASVPLTYLASEQEFISQQGMPEKYSFRVAHHSYDREKLNAAKADPEAKYLHVPVSVPERIKDLAQRITGNSGSPHQKALVIENYLKKNYAYNLDCRPVPEGREANDWFLFDEKKGVCSNFNSAFVILARASGIPARLVNGYKIDPKPSEQVVYADQAHAWSEIKLKDLGWITFDATGSGQGPSATVTEITAVNSPVLKGQMFNVAGTVFTVNGEPVKGVRVELFINAKKETNGGTAVGTGTVKNGIFNITALVPFEAQVGPYQLLAHCLGGVKYQDSWSDPPIAVQTNTAIELVAPQKVKISEQLQLRGKLTEESSKPISGQKVDIFLADLLITQLITDEQGQFMLWQSFSNVGDYRIKASFPGSDFYIKSSQEIQFQVLTPTRLRIVTPQKAEVKQPFQVEGSLSEETSGASFPNQEIIILIDGQPLKEKPFTSADGRFSLKYALQDKGLHHLEARFSGVPYYSESRAETVMEIEPAARQSGLFWIYPLVVVVVVVMAVGGILLIRRRTPKSPGVEALTAGDISEVTEVQVEEVEEFKDQLEPLSLRIEFPGIEPPLPDVWGEGEELEVVCSLKKADGTPLGAKILDFLIGKSLNRIITDAGGTGILRCTFQKKGQYQMAARYKGDNAEGTASATRTIRIVDYREEIVSLFRSLLEWLRSKSLNLPAKATPREIKQAITEANKVIPQESLEKVITGFEEADYSLHTINRENYTSMYLSQKEIREHEPAPPGIS